MAGIFSSSFLGYWLMGALVAFFFVWPLLKRICGTTENDLEKVLWSAGLGFLLGYTMYTALTRDVTKEI